MDIGIIGFGAIGQLLYKLIAEHAPAVCVRAIVERRAVDEALRGRLAPSTRVVSSVQELEGTRLDLVIECAGHDALRTEGPRALRAGADLLVASVGALADASIEATLHAAARASGRKVRIPSGAVGGLDVLGAARLVGLESVSYLSNKAPSAWKGTPAEGMVDLDALSQPSVFFTGDARTAALKFPQNANVAAAIALAGIGFERTTVRLTADPAACGNRHSIRAAGVFGEIDISILGRTLSDNPKTSMLAPYSLVRSLASIAHTVVVV